jgi:preprotein translocase subunit SecE
VADSKRRGQKAVDDRLDDEVFVETVDDDVADDADLDDDLDYADDADVTSISRRNGSTATRATSRGSARTAAGTTRTRPPRPVKTAKGEVPPGGNRIARFVREVVAELRKVNWPSRKELLTYTVVVLVFVLAMMSIVGGLDYGFAWLVSHVFAGK